jgi:hypothetical protein
MLFMAPAGAPEFNQRLFLCQASFMDSGVLRGDDLLILATESDQPSVHSDHVRLCSNTCPTLSQDYCANQNLSIHTWSIFG